MNWDRKLSIRFQIVLSFLTAVVLCGLGSGCGTMPSGRAWGENAIYPVEWKRIPQAARNAALDPVTWLPLVGAGVIAAGNWDHNVSDWATEHTPIFGSRSAAEDYSDVARDVLLVEGFATVLLTPSGSDAGDWFWNKARGAAVGAGGVALTDFATGELKDAIGRERPNGNGGSMPSGHSSAAFAGMALANRNLDYIKMNRYARTGLKVANVALATSVGWARVEGEKHFPTDVLVGAALGNFTTRFIYDAFLGTKPEDRFSFYVEPSLSGGKVFLSWSF